MEGVAHVNSTPKPISSKTHSLYGSLDPNTPERFDGLFSYYCLEKVSTLGWGLGTLWKLGPGILSLWETGTILTQSRNTSEMVVVLSVLV